MKKTVVLFMALSLLLLCACSQPFTGLKLPGAEGGTEVFYGTDGRTDAVSIVLTGDGAEIRGGGAKAEGSVVTVSAAGTYRVSGTLQNGQLIVDTGEDALDVTLILDGAEIRCADGPALWIRQAKKLRLEISGEENLLASGTEADLASFDDTRSGAALYSEDDLIVDGGGSLTVLGYLNNGVTCKDDFRMDAGVLTIQSANNGLRASESVTITGGTLTVRSGNDGMKTSSDKKAGKGFIELSGGSIAIDSGGDGISAVTVLRITGSSLTVNARQDTLSEQSCKGIKAVELVEISGGTVRINAEDDGVHSDGNVHMSGGTMTVMAATGIQAGVKGSGTGDVTLTGGGVFIGAAKQAVKAEGLFRADGTLTAICNSTKQAAPDSSGGAWLLGEVEGEAEDMVLVGSDEPFISPMRFRVLLYCSGGLRAGETYTVYCGERSYKMTASDGH